MGGNGLALVGLQEKRGQTRKLEGRAMCTYYVALFCSRNAGREVSYPVH